MTLDPRAPVVAPRARAAADGRDRQGARRLRRVGGRPATVLVMDEPTSALTSREVDAAVRADRAPDRARRRDRLHHAPARRGVPHRPPHHRACATAATSRPGRSSEVTVPELVRLMANRDLSEHFPEGPRRARRRAAARRSTDRRRRAARDISFSLHAGEVLGIAGLLGAGRTELARVVAGADRFDDGRMLVDGREVALPRSGRRDRARHRPAAGRSQGAGPRAGPDRRAQHRAAARPPAGAARRAAAPLRGATGGADRRRAARQGDARRSRCGC